MNNFEKALTLADEKHKKEIEDLSDYFATLQKSYDKEIEELKERLRLAEKGMYVLNNSLENEQNLQKIKEELKDFIYNSYKEKWDYDTLIKESLKKIEQIFSEYINTPSDTNSKKLDTFRSGGDNLICECGKHKDLHPNWKCKKFTPEKEMKNGK